MKIYYCYDVDDGDDGVPVLLTASTHSSIDRELLPYESIGGNWRTAREIRRGGVVCGYPTVRLWQTVRLHVM